MLKAVRPRVPEHVTRHERPAGRAASVPDLPLLSVLGLLAVAVGLRFIGINLDAGTMQHPDERFLTMLIGRLVWPDSLLGYLDSATSPLNPYNVPDMGFFVYGTLPLFIGKLFTDFAAAFAYFGLSSPARLLTAVVDVACMAVLYRMGSGLFDRRTGLLAAVLYGFSVLPMQLAQFFTVDPFLNLFMLLALWQSIELARQGRIETAAWAGFWWGCALASKISAASFLPVLLLAAAMAGLGRGLPWSARFARGALALAVAGLSFRFFQPYAFDGWLSLDPRFLEAFRKLADLSAEGAWFPPAFQWVQRVPMWFPLHNLALYGVGLPLFAAAAGGAVALSVSAWRAREPAAALLIVALLAAFAAVALLKVQSMRYLLPVYPLMALLAAWFVLQLAQRRRASRWGAMPLVAVLVATVAWALAFSAIDRSPMTRVAATHWIHDHVPTGAVLGVEYWDDALPLPLPGFDGGRFRQVQLFPTEMEAPEKRERLIAQLGEVDYIVVSSQRNYASVARLPESFPLAIRYYELLFGNLAGFQLVAEFDSLPRLPWLTRPDDGAEEAFSVYDHPRVLIYAKSSDFSIAVLSDALNRVTLPQPAWAPHGRGLIGDLAPLTDAHIANARQSLGVDVAAWVAVLVLAGLVGNALSRRLWPGAGLPGRALLLVLVAWLCAVGLKVGWWRLDVAAPVLLVGLIGSAMVLLWRGGQLAGARPEMRVSETVFWGVFLFFLALRVWNPAIAWGERPMDQSILSAYLRDATWPPTDPWFLGAPLQYHAWGQYVMALLGRIAGTPANLLYNLACALVPALAAELYVWTMLRMLPDSRRRLGVALLGVGLVLFTGNLSFWTNQPWLDGPSFNDFWAASRIMPVGINEFPFWTAVFADLHGHFIATIFSALMIAGLALRFSGQDGARTWWLIGFALGGLALTNAWAVPVYALLLLSSVLAAPRRALGPVLAAAVAVCVSAPFWHVAGERFTLEWLEQGTSLAHGLILFGPFLAVIAWWGLAGSAPRTLRGLSPWLLAAAATGLSGGMRGLVGVTLLLVVARVWGQVRADDGRTGDFARQREWLIATLALTGLCVLLGVEFFTVVDRMNTVFKYHFEAWILLALAAALALPGLARRRGTPLVAMLVLAGGLPTSGYLLWAWSQNPIVPQVRAGLDGLAYVAERDAGEAFAIAWLNRQPGQPGVLEAVGPPYGPYTRIASFTGLPTLVGWAHHVWQRGQDRDEIAAREAAVAAAYTTLEGAEALARHAVSFAVLGRLERETYGADAGRHWAEAGWEPVFRHDDTEIWRTARGVQDAAQAGRAR